MFNGLYDRFMNLCVYSGLDHFFLNKESILIYKQQNYLKQVVIFIFSNRTHEFTTSLGIMTVIFCCICTH